VPTLTVLASTNGIPGGKPLTEDLHLRGYLLPDEAASLTRSFPSHTAGGVPILAGTDAPNPGTSHGAALHRELEFLVEAGLSPAEALAAATSVPAKAFHLEDRGRIAPGLRADLVLVAGDPTRDITDTRAIVRIWKGGVPVERPLAPPPAPSTTAKPATSL